MRENPLSVSMSGMWKTDVKLRSRPLRHSPDERGGNKTHAGPLLATGAPTICELYPKGFAALSRSGGNGGSWRF